MMLVNRCLMIVTLLLTGCTSYRLDRTDQLYLAQSYLPLPKHYTVARDIPVPAPVAPSTSADCAAPVAGTWRSATVGAHQRPSQQVLPGMTLLVTQSSYRRNGADAVPQLSRWPWKLPLGGRCGADSDWHRADLLAVRHLLSGARLQAGHATPDTDYYLQLVRAAGCTTQACDFSRLRTRLLEPFAASLEVSFRDVGANYEQSPSPHDPTDSFPIPAESVMHIPVAGHDLAGWLARVNAVQADDFFRSPLPPAMGLKMDVGELCARLTSRRAAAPTYVATDTAGSRAAIARGADGHGYLAVSEPVCNFSMKRLSLKPSASWPQPGNKVPAIGTEVDLLTSSDPLLLFRPPAYRRLLDSSGRQLCPAGSNSACQEDDRLAQGFIDFDTLVELQVEGQHAPLQVSSSMSVAQFEREHGAGMKVVALRRASTWLPATLLLRELTDYPRPTPLISTATLLSDNALVLHFMPEYSEQWRRKRGVYLIDALKAQVIVAPGDRITLKR